MWLSVKEKKTGEMDHGKRRRSEKKMGKGVLSFFNTVTGKVVLLIVILFSVFMIGSMVYEQPLDSDSSLKAVIVDQLGSTFPSEFFIVSATELLEQAGYTVDYYSSDEVTVELYRNLPTQDYRLVILRVHSAAGLLDGKCDLLLFTSEEFSNKKYLYEQLADQIGWAGYYEGGPIYFAIRKEFVKHCMNGRLENAIVIMMGCDGYILPNMAKAFIEREAKFYIGWDGAVTATHTDQTTIQLLKHITEGNQTIKTALTETMKEIGPDPATGAKLRIYPEEE